ncbi:MAG: methylated-DNA-[protein]-cysteine S-methyltransferase [Candidatus Magnetoglobus multicellularis str. Araruama]|uniref:Methylated-DNA-[protein]-cysteine S-methyltransferase n=1 Tax=Candidatus Magnetoglobus multicellularis str. Araruama TaxID=890399 RepID=A0A1V1P723_9BACT|nr:MAG: methylated-DNA-[protein]-cysteine S-methyltransferase [Candidatus Magnetoglobus multicellularis str. Araruama]
MTVNHVIFQTPFGSAAMVYTCAPFQLQKVYLPRQSYTDLIQDIEQDFLISQNGYHSHIDVLIKRLQHYFCGHPITTPWKWLSWQKRTPLQIKTLKETALIPFGEVCSYQQLAKK